MATFADRCRESLTLHLGLGYHIAEMLLSAPVSANVVAVARTESDLRKLSAAYPGHVEYVSGDLADPKTSEDAVAKAVEKYGRIDGIVFNAAVIAPVARIADVDVEKFKELFDINFFAEVAAVSICFCSFGKKILQL